MIIPQPPPMTKVVKLEMESEEPLYIGHECGNKIFWDLGKGRQDIPT